MNTFKALIILAGIGLCAFCASTEEAIRQNEVVIDTLQKQLDSMQSSGEKKEAIEALQAHVDTVIEQQNKLLAQKTAPSTAVTASAAGAEQDFDTKIRQIVQEELTKAGYNGKSSNPYDGARKPTKAELDATKAAEDSAPALPEQKSEAVAQYEVALKLYEQGTYKEAASGFGRIIKTYPNDPIVGKALVHLAFCLEKQGDIEGASVVCEAAQKKSLDDIHQIDCQIIRMRFAKSKNNTETFNQIMKSLQGTPLTPEQQKAMAEAKGQPTAAAPAKPASITKPTQPAKN